MPLAEYDENSGLYWLDSSHAYTFNGTEEERREYERQLKRELWIENQLALFSKAGKLNAFLRKYGLVTYRCKRGCLLGAVFNYRGTKYFYRCDRVAKFMPVVSKGRVTERYVSYNQLTVDEFDLRPDRGSAVKKVGRCRHFVAALPNDEVLRDVEHLKVKKDKNIYLPRL